MKDVRKLLGICALGFCALAGVALAQSKPAPAFDRLKTLVGEWEMKAEDGTTSRIIYKLISNGTVLQESISGEGHEDGMVTMYHLDGDSILATHYCSAGNQPRLRAAAILGGDGEITFRLVDVSNRKPNQEGQIHGLVVRFQDANHFTQEWTGEEKNKMTATIFRWQRKK